MTDLQRSLAPALQYAIDAENAIRLCRKEMEELPANHAGEHMFVIRTYLNAILSEIFYLQERIKKLALSE